MRSPKCSKCGTSFSGRDVQTVFLAGDELLGEPAAVEADKQALYVACFTGCLASRLTWSDSAAQAIHINAFRRQLVTLEEENNFNAAILGNLNEQWVLAKEHIGLYKNALVKIKEGVIQADVKILELTGTIQQMREEIARVPSYMGRNIL